jgi:hypothetical protein
VRYTWLDVLVQRRFLPDYRIGYCPVDLKPDPLNEARGKALDVVYPFDHNRGGIDYSFGIGAPLSAGGWMWMPGYSPDGDPRPRRFEEHERDPGRRILAADGNWSYFYNLSGDGVFSGAWNVPAWYDNMVAYRHTGFASNLLLQDGHVDVLRYERAQDPSVNTARYFVWHQAEPVHVGPDSSYGMNFYPHTPPPRFDSTPPGDIMPKELVPAYYTDGDLWTLIPHK